MKIRNPKSAIRHAFTLIELLVVIGIIALLIGILIPVINSARKSAYATDTRNQLQVIGNAIDRYYTDFAAYPGVFSNSQITTGVTLTGQTGGNLTSSENVVLALCGGVSGTAGAPAYTYTDVGRGPLTFGTPQVRKQAYIDANPQTLSMVNNKLNGAADKTATWGSNVPEFIDRFPDAMPVVYMRAKVGAAATVDNTGTLQYNINDLTAYGAPATPSAPYNTWAVYMTNASIANTAKRQDTYMLISAGADRTFGTNDDICNFSF